MSATVSQNAGQDFAENPVIIFPATFEFSHFLINVKILSDLNVQRTQNNIIKFIQELFVNNFLILFLS